MKPWSLEAAAQWPAGVQLFLNNSPQVFADPYAVLAEIAGETVRLYRAAVPGDGGEPES